MENTDFVSWAIIEITGYKKLAGKVKSESLGGAPFLRIDVYSSPEKKELTQYYGPSFIYCITPVSKEVAIAFTKNNFQEPAKQWDLLPESKENNDDEWAINEDCIEDYTNNE